MDAGTARPQATLRFTSEGLGPRAFAPLLPTGSFEVDLDRVDADLIDLMDARFEVDLHPGTVEVPILQGESFPLEVPPRCRGRGWVRAARREEAGQAPETRVASAEISFDPPLVLHHVVPLLARLSALFEDRDLTDLLRRVGGSPTAARIREELGARLRPRLDRVLPPGSPERARLRRLGEDLAQGSRQAARVLLRHAAARPVRHGATWALDLRFSGVLEVFGRAPVPFESVRVPTPVLPAPSASLARLLSGDPLATAVVRRGRVPVERMVEALASTVAGLKGTFTARLDLPDVAVRAVMNDGTELSLDTVPPGPASIQASFEATATRDRFRWSLPRAEIALPGGLLAVRSTLEARARKPEEPGHTLPAFLAAGVARGAWPGDRVMVHLEADLLPGSRLDALDLAVRWDHPLLRGGGDLALSLRDLDAQGRLAAEVEPESGAGRTTDLSLSLGAGFVLGEGSHADDGVQRVDARHVEGRIRGTIQADAFDAACLDLDGEAVLDGSLRRRVDAFPELDVEAGDLVVDVAGRAGFQARACTRRGAEDRLEIDVDGSRVGLDLDTLEARLGPHRLHLPRGARLDARVREAGIDTSGLGRSAFEVAWDLHGASAVLTGPDASAELFVRALRQGRVDVTVSPAGGISITGEPGGLYDARYFNALINPDREWRRWLELLDDEEAFDHVVGAVRVLSADGARHLERARAFGRRVRAAFAAEGIRRPSEFIPGPAMSRVLSRVMTGGPEIAERLLPHVRRATGGEGVDVPALKALLDEVLPPHAWGWELDRGLRILGLLMAPTEPVPPGRRRLILPLAEDPAWTPLLSDLPRAGEIYRALASDDPLPEGFSVRLARVAPWLTLGQVQWILARERRDLRDEDVARLRFVEALKRRCRLIEESAGGLGYAPQAMAIGLFLGATVRRRPLPGEVDAPLPGEPPGWLAHPACLLGPEDVAVLLEAGLSAPVQGRAVQLNQRMLLDLVLAQPPGFTRHVLLAMSHGSVRILASVLNGLLDLDQGAMRVPLDMPALLSERLGVDLPRLRDYMAGGRWARRSYYEALNRAADQILASADEFEALRSWLQVDRRPASARGDVPEPLEAAARAAVARADALGARCRFTGAEPRRRAAARGAYEAAFEACRALLDAAPTAFHLPWFKEFHARNYEALTVLSVVRDVQEGVDRTREWMAFRLGAPVPEDEQALVDAVIEVLYDRPADRDALRRDPLVRLLLDPPPGTYRFSVVSCMGVVTDGAEGEELEQAFRRLEARRGVRVIRADTATVRSLDFNAARIEDAVRRVDTPWGYVGYSQGCANGLWAETRLLGGTPDQQALAEGLVARHFLYSAINGSAHGTCGDLKFLRTMVELDHLLSHYQAVLSRQAVDLGLSSLRRLLGSKGFVRTLGGVESLSQEGVLALGRECMVRAEAPTTSCRGRVRPDVLPDALKFLSNQLTRQTETEEHDTQVLVDDALGHPVYVENPMAALAEACDVPARVRTTHHWAPLRETTEFLTTARDRERCIYDVPKDAQVFPWIEVNARFGRIRGDQSAK